MAEHTPAELSSHYEEANRKLAAMHVQQQSMIADLHAQLQQREDFLARINHQLRTPLTAILGYSELMQQHSEIAHDVHLSSLHEAARSMLDVLCDMPQFKAAHPESWVTQARAVNLATLVPQMEGFFTYEAQKKNLSFSLHWDHTIPTLLIADFARIRQVLLILIHNAIRFTEQGSIVVNFALQETTQSHALVLCTVQDTGVGMAPQHWEVLFRTPPATEKTAQRFGRAGTNLLLAKQAIEWMGSQLHIDSAPEKGSTFSFLLTLPIAPVGSVEVATKKLPPQQHRQQAAVLVADDHAMNREMLQNMLQKLHIGTVDVAAGGIDVLAKCRIRSYDLLILDCQMPDMDGFATSRLLKNLPTTRHMPIIGITADILKADKARCLAAGMDDAFTKPVYMDTLDTILSKWL